MLTHLHAIFLRITMVVFPLCFLALPVVFVLTATKRITQQTAARIVFTIVGLLFVCGVLPSALTDRIIGSREYETFVALPGTGVSEMSVRVPLAAAEVKISDPREVAIFFKLIEGAVSVGAHHSHPVHTLQLSFPGVSRTYSLSCDSSVRDEYWLEFDGHRTSPPWRQLRSPELSDWLRRHALYAPPETQELRRERRLPQGLWMILGPMLAVVGLLSLILALKRSGRIGSKTMTKAAVAVIAAMYVGQFAAFAPMGRVIDRQISRRNARLQELVANPLALRVQSAGRDVNVADAGEVASFARILAGGSRPVAEHHHFIPADVLTVSFPPNAEKYRIQHGPGRDEYSIAYWDGPDYGVWDELSHLNRFQSEELSEWLRRQRFSSPDIP